MSEESQRRKLFIKRARYGNQSPAALLTDSTSPVELADLIQKATPHVEAHDVAAGIEVGCAMPGHRKSGQAAAVVLAALMRIHKQAT